MMGGGWVGLGCTRTVLLSEALSVVGPHSHEHHNSYNGRYGVYHTWGIEEGEGERYMYRSNFYGWMLNVMSFYTPQLHTSTL